MTPTIGKIDTASIGSVVPFDSKAMLHVLGAVKDACGQILEEKNLTLTISRNDQRPLEMPRLQINSNAGGIYGSLTIEAFGVSRSRGWNDTSPLIHATGIEMRTGSRPKFFRRVLVNKLLTPDLQTKFEEVLGQFAIETESQIRSRQWKADATVKNQTLVETLPFTAQYKHASNEYVYGYLKNEVQPWIFPYYSRNKPASFRIKVDFNVKDEATMRKVVAFLDSLDVGKEV